MNKKAIWIVGIAVIIIALVVSFGNKNQSSDKIRLAFIGPLTGDGAAWGEIEKNTIQLAVDEINASGGIKGKQMEVVYEDGKCDGATALSAAKKLVEIENIKFLLVSCSQEIVPIGPYAESHKIIAFTSYASASNISDLGRYIFRNSYTNRDMGASMAKVALEKGKTAAVISEQSAFASDLRDLFIDSYEKNGGKILTSEKFDQESRDFKTQITKIVDLNPSVVAVNPNGPDTGIVIIKQLRQLGYRGSLVGNFFGGSIQVQKTPEADGMIYVSDPVFSESPIKKRVFAEYEKKYGSSPDLPWPVGARYDAVYILKQAFENVGNDPTAVMEYLHNMPTDFTGVLGTYRFKSDSADVTNVHPSIAVIQNGVSVPVK